ncbi:MAG: prephenate dehydratase [Thermodesulfobacteriota bacterium]|nr:prephenate dehydratase [Thermodesulfobacteriota bacterium]
MNQVEDQHKEQSLADLRRDINKTDDRLLELLNRRARLCKAVGAVKSETEETVFKPFREKEVLSRLVKANPGILPEDHLRAIYREILSSSRKLQKPQQAVYLGPEGTFSFFAGMELLGSSTDFEPCRNLDEVFAAVAGGRASLGIVPLENSLQGSVGQNLDLFLKYDVYIQAEIYCRISHYLMGAGDGLSAVKTVCSHARALEQCMGWLDTHLPDVDLVPVRSTAAAADKAAERPEWAAIGHKNLANRFALNFFASHIEDTPDNWTRFIVIGNDPPTGGNRDKTSLLFTLSDRSGALVNVLQLLARSNINMRKLESRPLLSESMRYIFFADVECDLTDEEYDGLKAELVEHCHTLRILGSYPAGQYMDDP